MLKDVKGCWSFSLDQTGLRLELRLSSESFSSLPREVTRPGVRCNSPMRVKFACNSIKFNQYYHFNRPCFILTSILIKSAKTRKAFVKCAWFALGCSVICAVMSVVSWSFLLRLFWFLNWAGRSLLLVAGLLKELKIANAGILGGYHTG